MASTEAELDPTSLSNQARACLSQGQLDDAKALFLRAIQARRKLLSGASTSAPISENSLQLSNELSDLAHVELASGNVEAAMTNAREAVTVCGGNAIAHCNLGAVLRSKRDYRLAADCYIRASEIKPDFVQAGFFAGVSLVEAGDFDRAISIWRKLLRKNKNPLGMLRDVIFVLASVGQAARSEEFAREAMTHNPSDEFTLCVLSNAMAECGHDKEAEQLARRAIAGTGDRSALGRFALGVAFQRRGNFADAVQEYRRAIELDPSLARAHANLGDALIGLKRLDEAIAALSHAADLAPADAYIFLKYSSGLIRSRQTEEAVIVAERAVELAPTSAFALMNLGTALFDLGRCEEAIVRFRKAIELEPNNAEIRCNLGIALLATGQLREGWREYAHREQVRMPNRFKPWTGDDLGGRPIALIAEQGYGDSIQFIRYAKWVAEARHGVPILVCAPALVDLMKRVAGIDSRVVTSIAAPELSDVIWYQRLMALGEHAGVETMDSIQPAGRYVEPPQVTTELLRTRLMEDPVERRPRVGIVWSGNPNHENDQRRSIPVQEMLRAIDTRCSLFSLQIGPAVERDAAILNQRGVVVLSDLLTDFSKTAYAIDQMDLIVAVDTSVAHLAGAMDKPVWTLLPANADWRWQRAGNRTPWYSRMRLFRQQNLDDWSPVVSEVGSAMHAWVDDFQPESVRQ